MEPYQAVITKYRTTSSKLSDPITITSAMQMSILLYDILGLESKDPKKPRSTEEKAIAGIDHPVITALLDYREISKLLTTYIETIPAQVKEKTGRLHGRFNQYGTLTGRYSSSEPNLQKHSGKK